jgi:hypothetical protein
MPYPYLIFQSKLCFFPFDSNVHSMSGILSLWIFLTEVRLRLPDFNKGYLYY